LSVDYEIGLLLNFYKAMISSNQLRFDYVKPVRTSRLTTRPVTWSSPRKFFAIPGKMCWT